MQTAKYKNALTIEGKQVLKVLMSDYNMNESDAVRLIAEGGLPLAIAIINRKRL